MFKMTRNNFALLCALSLSLISFLPAVCSTRSASAVALAKGEAEPAAAVAASSSLAQPTADCRPNACEYMMQTIESDYDGLTIKQCEANVRKLSLQVRMEDEINRQCRGLYYRNSRYYLLHHDYQKAVASYWYLTYKECKQLSSQALAKSQQRERGLVKRNQALEKFIDKLQADDKSHAGDSPGRSLARKPSLKRSRSSER